VITLRWALFTVALASMLAGAAISAFADNIAASLPPI
jgi:hypothetical protein